MRFQVFTIAFDAYNFFPINSLVIFFTFVQLLQLGELTTPIFLYELEISPEFKIYIILKNTYFNRLSSRSIVWF